MAVQWIQSSRFGTSAAFSPLDISGCVLWYDASDTATITSSGGLVSQWDDKSTSGLNATQATDASKPTTGATTQNGLNVIDTDGGDAMTLGTGVRLGRDILSTFFIVVRKAAVTNKHVMFRSSDSSSAIESTASSSAGTPNLTQGGRNAAAPSINTAAWYILHGGTITSGLYSRFGASGVFGTTSLFLSGTAPHLTELLNHSNSTYSFQGSTAEIIFYNGNELTNAEHNDVGNYLAAKWNVGWSDL